MRPNLYRYDFSMKPTKKRRNAVKTNDDNEHNFSHKFVFYDLLMTEN